MTIHQAIEAEAQAQAICMLTEDFSRAYRAFVAKQKPRFERKLNMQNEKGPSAGPPQAGPHPLGGSVAVLGDRGAAIPSGLAVFRGSASRVGA